MAASNPKNAALVALAKLVGDRYRATGNDQFSILLDAHPNRGVIVATAYATGESRLSVLVPMTFEGWNAHIEVQLRHEFITVCQRRIELVKITEAYLAGQTEVAANAYR